VSGASADHLAALVALEGEAEAKIRSADGREALHQLRTEFLGRKAGRLTAILKVLPELDPDTRRAVGQRANAAKQAIEQWLDAAEAERAAAPGARALDLTMPGRPVWRGARHPVTLVTDRVTRIFRELGFTRYVGPEAESERNNFFALRVMEAYAPPIRVLMPGMCYRKDPFDASHAPVFSQVEGLAVDEGITFVDLKATLTWFAQRFFREGTKVRFRPSFFPFTEPSAEMDVECQICHGAGCPTCKHTGWAEMLGCGMVDPAVFVNVGLDPERYTGWAFGMGPGRMAQQLFGIGDIRLLYDADVRLSAQFVDAT